MGVDSLYGFWSGQAEVWEGRDVRFCFVWVGLRVWRVFLHTAAAFWYFTSGGGWVACDGGTE